MRPRGPNLSRRQDLEAAIARCKPKDVITLQGLADAYGTSKSNFTNVLRQIERMFDMPPYQAGPKGVHVYPAAKALKVVLAFETRNDAASDELQKRQAAILGKGEKRKDRPTEQLIPLGDMAIASRVMAETEERERMQGLYCALEEQARVAGVVFSAISNFMSTLHITIDPNGKLPAAVRALVKTNAHKENLRIHREMKDILSGHAIPNQSGPKKARSANGRAGRSRARRKRA